jgi:hypothetical protein
MTDWEAPAPAHLEALRDSVAESWEAGAQIDPQEAVYLVAAIDDLTTKLAAYEAEVDRLTAELAKAQAERVGKTPTHTYDVIVWLMEDNHWFGADGWTWCKVIDGDPDDYTGDLPRCADEADARAKAAAWLASVTAAEPTAEGAGA